MGKLQDFLMSRADIGDELVEGPDCHPARASSWYGLSPEGENKAIRRAVRM